MDSTPATDSQNIRQEPLYPMLHWIRTGGLALGCAVIALHVLAQSPGPLFWALLALQFLVYPHALHWHTRRAANAKQAELIHFLLDAFLLGLWSAWLGYPLWIAFAFLAGNAVSIILYDGPRSAAKAVGLFFLGGLPLFMLMGRPLAPDTAWLVTVLCMVGLLVFLLLTTSMAHRRNLRLADIGAALEQSQQALYQANDSLQAQLNEIQLLQGKLSEQANRDPLTGLYNRRYLDSTLDRELARCKREGLSLCLMLIDIDHFKRVNDSYGHLAGDEVLKKLANILDAHARSADVVCRYGGEEFLMVLPGMPLTVAREKAEGWRSIFAETVVTFGDFRMQATLSVGICAYPGGGKTAAELIDCADRALYRAKSEGRNRVVVSAT